MKNASRPSILIVEDDPAFQSIYAEILGDDYDLQIVGDKDAAISHLGNRAFDVALVDMRLKADERGNTDGLDVAQYIRDLHSHTAVILKSGFPTQTREIETRLEQLNLFGVLDKSADGQVKQLLQLVAKAAAKRK